MKKLLGMALLVMFVASSTSLAWVVDARQKKQKMRRKKLKVAPLVALFCKTICLIASFSRVI